MAFFSHRRPHGRFFGVVRLFPLLFFPLLYACENSETAGEQDSLSGARDTLALCEQLVDSNYQDKDQRIGYQRADSLLRQLSQYIEPGQGFVSDTVLAYAYLLRGRIYFPYSKDTSWAGDPREMYQKALELRKRHFRGRRDPTTSRLYHNIGVTYYDNKKAEIGHYNKALDYGDSCQYAHPPWNTPSRYYRNNLKVMGLSYVYQGDAYTGMPYLKMALDAGQAAADTAFLLDTYLNISDAYRQANLYARAFDRARKALELSKANPGISREAEARLYMGNALQDSAFHFPDSLLWRKALTYTEKARNLFREMGEDKIEPYVAACRNQGELYRRMGRFKEAEAVLREGLGAPLPKEDWGRALTAELKVNLGEVFLDRGRYGEAIAELEAARTLLLPQKDTNAKEDVLDPAVLLQAWDDLARVYAARSGSQGDLKKAAEYGEEMVDLIGLMRAGYTSEETKQALSKLVQPIYKRQFDVHKRLYRLSGDKYHLQKAFDFSEYSKYASLLKGLQLQNTDQFPDSLQSLKREEKRLSLGLAKLSSQAQDSTGQAERAKQQRALEKTRRQLSAAYPKYASLLEDAPVLPLAEVRDRVLYRGQSMLSYFVGDDSLYAFWIGPRGYGLRALPIGRSDLAQAYRDFMSSIDSDNLYSAAYASAGETLYRGLVQPVEPYLSGRVVIVPDESFANLPFEALPRSAGGLPGVLLDRYVVSYAFSANLLREMRMQRPAPGKSRTLAVFNPSFHQPGKQAVASLPDWLQQAVRQLGDAPRDKEVRGIREEVGVRSYQGVEASKKRFWDACAVHSAVHITTHGYVGESNPKYNFMLFHQDEGNIQKENILFADELYAHPLGIDFAFLSACQTAKGKLQEGEGQFSIARGLAFAGVKSFVATLWSINTNRTAGLAPRFYQYLSEGIPKDEALARAKRDFIRASRDNASPYFWAGLAISGDTAPLPIAAPRSKAWAAVLFALAGFLWYLHYGRPSRHSKQL